MTMVDSAYADEFARMIWKLVGVCLLGITGVGYRMATMTVVEWNRLRLYDVESPDRDDLHSVRDQLRQEQILNKALYCSQHDLNHCRRSVSCRMTADVTQHRRRAKKGIKKQNKQGIEVV